MGVRGRAAGGLSKDKRERNEKKKITMDSEGGKEGRKEGRKEGKEERKGRRER